MSIIQPSDGCPDVCQLHIQMLQGCALVGMQYHAQRSLPQHRGQQACNRHHPKHTRLPGRGGNWASDRRPILLNAYL